MYPTLLALGTAVPLHVYPQQEARDKCIEVLSIEGEKAEHVRHLYNNSAIDKRHSVIGDFKQERSHWHFWGPDYPRTVPNMAKRNEIYKKEAPKLALEAAEKALQQWGGDPSDLTHIISVSCTGSVAPGIEFTLMSSLGLKPTINRLGINFMGCFGAFKGLSVAQAFAKEHPSHRVLVICTELCSLHLQTDLISDTIVGNSLFADGAAATIVGTHPQKTEKPLWEIVNSHTMAVDNTLDKMSWEVSERGFIMRLSHTVPVYLGRHIKSFTQVLLPPTIQEPDCDWAIHPGGKSILQAIEKALKLQPNQTLAAWKTLANYGNMSSATFLFVLDELSRQSEQREWTVGLAFGPGLSMEGTLLRKTT